jgi:O-antigen/teichoic acid export membrane protein
MSDIKNLFHQSSHYLLSFLILSLTSFVSFPVLTRILSVPDYGILGLTTVTIFFVTAFCKSGLQNAMIRFYDEYVNVKNEPDFYYSTFFFGSLLTNAVTVVLYFAVVNFYLKAIFGPDEIKLLNFVSSLILLRGVRYIFTGFWKAERRTGIYNMYGTVTGILSFALGIAFLLFYRRDIYGLLIGQIVADVISLIWLVYYLLRDYGSKIKINSFSRLLFKESLFYGLPLMWQEITSYILVYCDRYAIAFLMTKEYLGLYSAGQTMAANIAAIVVTPVGFAVVPLYMKTWTRDGPEATKEFLSNSLKYISLFAFPVIFGVVGVGKPLLLLLASQKYAQAYSILPFLITGSILFGFTSLFNAGLLIYKKSVLSMVLTIAAGIVSMILNFVLIKQLGFMGAAMASFTANCVYIGMIIYFSFKYLSFPIPFKEMTKYLAYSAVMFVSLCFIGFENMLYTLLVRVGVGMIVYICLILFFERELTRKILLNSPLRNLIKDVENIHK